LDDTYFKILWNLKFINKLWYEVYNGMWMWL
jgi:hypothetical protein